MLLKYDELNIDRVTNEVFYQFIEPIMPPSFFPTYKKYEGRDYVELHDIKSWYEKTYRV